MVKTIRGITNSKSPVRVVRFAKLRVLDFFLFLFYLSTFRVSLRKVRVRVARAPVIFSL